MCSIDFDMTLVIASCFSAFFLEQLPTKHVTLYTTLHASSCQTDVDGAVLT